MRSLDQRIRLAKTVLHELSKQPLSRTEIERRTVRKAGTHSTFEGIFHYLIKAGYIQKSDQKQRAPYILTEKGAKFMEAI